MQEQLRTKHFITPAITSAEVPFSKALNFQRKEDKRKELKQNGPDTLRTT